MKTYISDNFTLEKLECQYFEVCKYYDHKKCSYTRFCGIRQILKTYLEDYVKEDNLKLQIKLILSEKKNKEKWAEVPKV